MAMSYTLRFRSFCARLFSSLPTAQQVQFDRIFGLILPACCLLLDPAVFRGFNILVAWRFVAYAAFIIVGLVAARLLYFDRPSPLAASVYAGVLFISAIGSFAIGIALLPISILGLIVIIGFLGFLPFITAFVFLRMGVRTLKQAQSALTRPKLIGALLAGMLLVILPAGLLHTWAYAQWPEISQAPIFPGTEHVQISDFAMTDSGLAMEQNLQFDTDASEGQVRQFYREDLLRNGWYKDLHGDPIYASASGRTYSIYVITDDQGNARRVRISLKYHWN